MGILPQLFLTAAALAVPPEKRSNGVIWSPLGIAGFVSANLIATVFIAAFAFTSVRVAQVLKRLGKPRAARALYAKTALVLFVLVCYDAAVVNGAIKQSQWRYWRPYEELHAYMYGWWE